MSLNRPSLEHDVSYPAPRGTVLLLSCIDPRVLDEAVLFMDHDNLTNRYDHVVLAGAALGALGAPLAPDAAPSKAHWRQTFFDHLRAAIDLHNIKDIYILEHRHCGAYYKVFKVCPEYGETPAEQTHEADCHFDYAQRLEDEILAWAAQEQVPLKVWKFLMDLRGRVAPLVRSGPRPTNALPSPSAPQAAAKPRGAKKKTRKTT